MCHPVPYPSSWAAVFENRATTRLCRSPLAAEHRGMAEAQRVHTYDDDLHERRRHLAIIRPPVDFEAERLRRLREKSRDTIDP